MKIQKAVIVSSENIKKFNEMLATGRWYVYKMCAMPSSCSSTGGDITQDPVCLVILEER